LRIGFHTNSLSFRGAEIAVFDYALHNQSLLQNESLVFYKSQLPSEPTVIEKFSQHFKLLPYQDHSHLARLADQEKIDKAAEMVGAGRRVPLGGKKSTEASSVNKVSPVQGRGPVQLKRK
jgi:hypothetical protein